MSPNKKAFIWIGITFLVMCALDTVILHSHEYGPAIGSGALCLVWLWLAWQIAKNADAENDRIRTLEQRAYEAREAERERVRLAEWQAKNLEQEQSVGS